MGIQEEVGSTGVWGWWRGAFCLLIAGVSDTQAARSAVSACPATHVATPLCLPLCVAPALIGTLESVSEKLAEGACGRGTWGEVHPGLSSTHRPWSPHEPQLQPPRTGGFEPR